ncbi:DUF7260 family protein [Halorubrum sp. DTA98]|uniref:DUF7260 family protein n=1 Tax=Halorubrum sp. DTA98 TaxID=3402163 RepID=UPI003AAAB6B4
MSINAGGDATFRIPNEEPVAAECASATCEVSSALTEPAVVGVVALLGLVAFVAFAYVRDAKECCREERRRVVDERDAFEEFADRIETLDPTPMDATTAAIDGPVVGVQRGSGFATPGDVRLRRVVDAYTETVVSLPHYREEYDETVAESLAAELGPDATSTVLRGGTLSPELQSTIVARSRRAVSSRESLADAIDAELDELDHAEARLTEIDRSRNRLSEHLDGVPTATKTGARIDVWERLEGLESACDDAVENRQQHVRDPPMSIDIGSGDDSPTFYEYLYAPLEEVTYPVLAEFSELADRIRADRDRLARRIARGSR